jgi:hypothetical protein
MLPSKTIPDVKNRKHHALKPKTMKTTAAAAAPLRKKAKIASGTEVEVSPRAGPSSGKTAARNATISPESSFEVSYPVPVKVCDVSLIYSIVPFQ